MKQRIDDDVRGSVVDGPAVRRGVEVLSAEMEELEGLKGGRRWQSRVRFYPHRHQPLRRRSLDRNPLAEQDRRGKS